MGSGESTTRKVSFGVDDEDRVRILRGVKLSEDVLQRMKGVANIAPDRPTPASPQKDKGASPKQSPQHRTQPNKQFNKPTSFAKEEQTKFERQQTIKKEESAKVAHKEKEVVREDMAEVLTRERQLTRQEAVKTKQLSADEIEVMTQRLHEKGAQLKALEAFYREQLAQLEKRNWERYLESKEEFHQAAAKTETTIRARNTTGMCPGLQAQILSCYRENGDQTLKCSDLAKQYMQCINAAKENLHVNHG